VRSPYARRKPRNPFDRAALGVRVRMAERSAAPLNMTEARRKLMEAVDRGEIRPGTKRFEGGYRWHHGPGQGSETVTSRVLDLLSADWAVLNDGHVELTLAGREAMGGAS